MITGMKDKGYIFTDNTEIERSAIVDLAVKFVLDMKEKYPGLTYDEVARQHLGNDYHVWENRKKIVDDPIVAAHVRPHILKWIKDN
jgi:hypothetical protein